MRGCVLHVYSFARDAALSRACICYNLAVVDLLCVLL